MQDWKKLALRPSQSIREAMEIIGRESLGIALVVNSEDNLLGIITDGDIRRGLLRSLNLNDSVELVMNNRPITAIETDSQKKRHTILKKKKILHLPILNANNRLIGIEVIKAQDTKLLENAAFLIAGGLGTRLRPLTDTIPKPLLSVGGKPVLQIILESLIEAGVSKFYISVNYMAEKFVEFFGNGEKWGVEIKYIFENEPLGTAGSLSLLEEKLTAPLLVMNADLLTKIDVAELFSFHYEHKSKATMCVREYDFQVPYGVVQTEEHNFIDIVEKPIHKFFVNAGIYILDPEIIDFIPKGRPYTMPELLKKVNETSRKVSVFPVHEYWLDIGQLEDFKRAQLEVDKVFK